MSLYLILKVTVCLALNLYIEVRYIEICDPFNHILYNFQNVTIIHSVNTDCYDFSDNFKPPVINRSYTYIIR